MYNLDMKNEINQVKVLSNYQKVEVYGINKANYSIFKKLLVGFMAGLFVSLGYIGYLKIYCNGGIDGQNGVTLFLGGTMFTIGILLCVFFNGSLFTANCMIWCPFVTKKVKGSTFATDLVWTLIGNYTGTALFALFAWAIGIFGTPILGDATNQAYAVYEIALHKIEMDWWKTILSAILCNIIIVCAILSYITFESKTAVILISFFLISVFVFGGYQHVVANMFLTSLGAMIGGQMGVLTPEIIGEIFWQCLLMSAIGNFIGGAFMVSAYYYLNHPNKFKKTKVEITTAEHFKKLSNDEIKNVSTLKYWQLPPDNRNKYKQEKKAFYNKKYKEVLVLQNNQKVAILKNKLANYKKELAATKDKNWIPKLENKINKLNNKIIISNNKLKAHLNKIK